MNVYSSGRTFPAAAAVPKGDADVDVGGLSAEGERVHLDVLDVVERPDSENFGPVLESCIHVSNDVPVLENVAEQAAQVELFDG